MEVTTPGRICLFGEHQDYLGLPVIAMAISLRISITGKQRNDKQVVILKSDLNETEFFSLVDLKYSKPRDYFKSGIKICQKNGLTFSNGFECEIKSQIPINAGTSSSSALNVSWIHFLSKIADNSKNWDQKKIGELAFDAEVTEFNEPGGMMDQYSTAIGNLIYLESQPRISIKKLNPKLNFIVEGDNLLITDSIAKYYSLQVAIGCLLLLLAIIQFSHERMGKDIEESKNAAFKSLGWETEELTEDLISKLNKIIQK